MAVIIHLSWGVSTPGMKFLGDTLDAARSGGATAGLDEISREWSARARLLTLVMLFWPRSRIPEEIHDASTVDFERS